MADRGVQKGICRKLDGVDRVDRVNKLEDNENNWKSRVFLTRQQAIFLIFLFLFLRLFECTISFGRTQQTEALLKKLICENLKLSLVCAIALGRMDNILNTCKTSQDITTQPLFFEE